MTNKALRIALKIILAIILLAFAGLAVALQWRTLSPWWKPFGWCIPLAVLIGVATLQPAKRVLNWKKNLFVIPVGIIFWLSIFYGGLYTLNFVCSLPGTAELHKVEIVNKYARQEQRYRRIGRRTVRSETTNVYRIVLAMPDSTLKQMRVSASDYVNLRRGKFLSITLEKGLFGMTVIKHVEMPGKRRKNH